MSLIVAEKPRAGQRMESALEVKTIPAVGHLLELKSKKRVWAPPFFEVEWVPRKRTLARLKQIVNALKTSEEVYIATDPDEEGQLIALNILRQAEMSPSLVKRMMFSSLEREELVRAFKNPVDFDVSLALAAETRHFLDWYFGMNISKVVTKIFRKHGIRKGRRALTPIGRVQSPTLSYLADHEQEIGEHVSRDVWYVDVYGVYGDNLDRFFEIRRAWFDKEETAEAFTQLYSKGEISEVYEAEYEITYLPPNKDYVMKEALDKGISAALVDAVLQDLYLDQYISYPRSSSQKYVAHGVDTQKYLKRLLDVIPEAKQALGNPPREGEQTDVHPAIYPIKPYVEKDLRGTIWNIIAQSFVKCHLPPEKHSYPRTEVKIGDKTYISFDDPDLDEGDTFDLSYKIGKGRTRPAPRYDEAKVYDWMTKQRIGTTDTRSQILTKLLKAYLYQTEDGIYVTSKGMKIVNVLQQFCPSLIDVKLTRRFEEYVEAVKKGNSPTKLLEEGKQIVTEIVNVLYTHEDEVVKLLR